MRAHAMRAADVSEAQIGWAVTESIRTRGGQRLLPKGGMIDRAALSHWSEVEDRELHLIELEEGDLHENEAGRQISEAATGDGIEVDGPYHSRYNLRARHRGLLVIDRERVDRINRVGSLSLFTRYDRQAVEEGVTVAGVKATPIVVPASEVEEISGIASESGGPVVDVRPFTAHPVYVVATEDLHPRLRESFGKRVESKVAWYGSELIGIEFVDPEPEAVEGAFRRGLERGAEIFMVAGGNTLDPLDPILTALPRFGASMVHHGAPADPGSLFWAAQVDGKPILNLASCSMYSQATVVDLMLPVAMAGLPITSGEIVRLGYGGLLEDDQDFRFPKYDGK